jgi:predicted phage tail protein
MYYYRVRARNGCSVGGSSNNISVQTIPPGQPTAYGVSSYTCTSFIASWSVPTGATGFFLDVATDAAFTTFVTGYSNLYVGYVSSYNVTGVVNNVVYYYRVRSGNNCGNSGNSNSISYIIAAPTIPSPGTCSIGCTSFGLCWASTSGATNYYIDVSLNASFSSFVAGWNNTAMGNVTSYTVTGLITGVNYYYRMRSGNACGSSGNSINLMATTTGPGTPTVSNATLTDITCNSFTAVWTASLGATYYLLDVSLSPTFATFVGVFNNFNVGGATSFSISGLALNTTYYYRVRAANGCNVSLSSDRVTVFTGSPVLPVVTQPATSVTTISLTANWTSASSATTYYLDVATDAAFANYVTGYNNLNVGNVITYNVTGLTTGTTYYYRVRAANSCGTNANSGTTSQITN